MHRCLLKTSIAFLLLYNYFFVYSIFYFIAVPDLSFILSYVGKFRTFLVNSFIIKSIHTELYIDTKPIENYLWNHPKLQQYSNFHNYLKKCLLQVLFNPKSTKCLLQLLFNPKFTHYLVVLSLKYPLLFLLSSSCC